MWIAQLRIDDEIRKAFPLLPANISVIPPESDINSYTLTELSDVIIVYSTKMGLEAALMGIPLIIVGDAFYGNKGFCLEPNDLGEYHRMLDRINRIEPFGQNEIRRIRGYANYYYFRRTLPLPNIVPNPDRPWVRDFAGFLPGQHEGLDVVCSGILTGAPFILDKS